MADPALHLNKTEYNMLYGLSFANRCFISASEHNHALALCERGLANAWTVSTGAHMWEITDKGKEAVEYWRTRTFTD